MIGRIRGLLIEKQPPLILVELASGLAYEIEASMSTIYKLPVLGQEVVLYTHLVVREDADLLYGFATREERSLFRALIKVNGVGPKLALAILSSFLPDAFIQCVNHGDVASLVKIPGVGKKTAERLVVEMRDRLTTTGGDDSMVVMSGAFGHSPVEEAIQGLVALGYKPQEASRSVGKITTTDLSCEEIIRLVLQGMMV
jgi:Holliday junction DNA helicase RuvA